MHELEQVNKKQESFVYELSIKNRDLRDENADLRDEKHANKKQVHELLKEIYKPDALQKLVDDLTRRLKQDA